MGYYSTGNFSEIGQFLKHKTHPKKVERTSISLSYNENNLRNILQVI